MHFLGFKWDNSSCLPFIQYRSVPNKDEVKFYELKIGSPINITFKKEKYCIGHFSNPEYNKVSCKHNIDLKEANSRQCLICQNSDSALFLPLQTLNEYQRNIVKSQPHLNYISVLGKDSIKVGVAAKVRKYTRVCEQGSHASIFFTECDGITAREIEELVSKNFNIKQSINVSAKINALYDYLSNEKAREKLMEVYYKAESILKDRYGNFLLKEPEYSYNVGFYNINNEEKVIYYINNIDNLIGISGKVKSVIGEILLLADTQNRLIAFNSKLMLGRIIDIDEQVDSNIISVGHFKKIVYQKVADNLTLF